MDEEVIVDVDSRQALRLPSKDHTNTEQEKGLILTIPYISGLSESIQSM